MNTERTKAKISGWIKEAIDSMPYEVWHPEGNGTPPRFQTWDEAIAKQVEWNQSCPGHIARRRKP